MDRSSVMEKGIIGIIKRTFIVVAVDIDSNCEQKRVVDFIQFIGVSLMHFSG